MKKGLSILMVISLMAMLLTGCGNKAASLPGTWEVDSVEVDGTKYALSELEAMEDYSASQTHIILKEGGKAYVSDSGTEDIVDWTQNGNTIKIGESDCSIVEGLICLITG